MTSCTTTYKRSLSIGCCVALLISYDRLHGQKVSGNPALEANMTYIMAIVCVIAAIVSVALIAYRHIRALNRTNQWLEQTVVQQDTILKYNQKELTAANSSKRNFLANMNHEIRNPLNGILGITRLIREDASNHGKQSEQIEHLHTCANQLHQILGQTLDYSSLEAGNISLDPQSFSPNDLINNIIELHKSQIEDKGLGLKLDIPVISGTWVGDPALLRQILNNLISNAIKYTQRGHIELTLSYETNGREIEASFKISDTGPGIPANKQNYIFEKFTRLASPMESETQGTGLGLAIASQMALLMAGRLDLENKKEQGACFLLKLPFIQGDLLTAPTDSTDFPPHQLRGRKILIADDMDFNRYINKVMLEKMGAQVVEARNGVTALEILKNKRFDLAILDINMPGMSGVEVVQAILADTKQLPPRLVALSAHTTSEMQAQCLSAGFELFIEKPLAPQKLEGIFSTSTPTTTKATQKFDNSLMNYLANNDPTAMNAIEKRYRAAFLRELECLKGHLEADDDKARRGSVHKLKGLSSIKKDKVLLDLLESISTTIASNGSTKACMDICNQMADHLESETPTE